MSALLVPVIAAVAGTALGPLLRAEIFHSSSVSRAEHRPDECPYCQIPVAKLTVLALRRPLPISGRCRGCGHRIGPLPGTVELAAGTTLGLLAHATGNGPTLLVTGWAALFAIILSFVDVAAHRLPNRLVLAGLVETGSAFLLIGLADGTPGRLLIALFCMIAAMLGYLVLAIIPRGYGLGDVKAAALAGLVTGWFGVSTAIVSFIAGLVLAGVTGLGLLLGTRGRNSDLPHGPFMFVGALVAILAASA